LDQFIVTRAAGRELTRSQMIKILIDAGYSKSSAEGRMSSSHPLFHRTGPDRYRLVGNTERWIGPPRVPRSTPSG
jgi:hypothetical protein